jgi:FkbM family methyltransferase
LYNTFLSYSRELSFALRDSVDWQTRAVLLKNTVLFHVSNAFGRKIGGGLPFTVRLQFGIDHIGEILIRPFSGDLFVLYEVLLHRCYEIRETLLPPARVQVILDCGANVGITALYFAWRYPNAHIFCIEPDDQNFELLKRNSAAEPRIVPIHGALVGRPRKLAHLSTSRPAWGNFVTDGEHGIEVPAFTIDQILNDNGLSRVDLLKVDIEGAEKEVFANGQFLSRVGHIIIELHNDYSLDDFLKDVAPWRFRAVVPVGTSGVKMINATRAQEDRSDA